MSGSVLCCALAGRQLSTALAPFAVIVGVGLAHVVLRAGDGWVDVLLGSATVRLLLLLLLLLLRWRRLLRLLLLLLLDRCRRTGLASAGSKEMFP